MTFRIWNWWLSQPIYSQLKLENIVIVLPSIAYDSDYNGQYGMFGNEVINYPEKTPFKNWRGNNLSKPLISVSNEMACNYGSFFKILINEAFVCEKHWSFWIVWTTCMLDACSRAFNGQRERKIAIKRIWLAKDTTLYESNLLSFNSTLSSRQEPGRK